MDSLISELIEGKKDRLDTSMDEWIYNKLFMIVGKYYSLSIHTHSNLLAIPVGENIC